MRTIVSTVFLLLAPTLVLATPPQVVSVDETLVGYGGPEKLLFLLRKLEDNLGSHSRLQTDLILIARSKSSNQDVYHWPIKRSIDNGASHVDTEGDPRHVTVPLEFDHSPWHVIKAHHAGLVTQTKADVQSEIEILKNRDGMLISATTPRFAYGAPEGTPERTSYWVSYTQLASDIETSLSETRYNFPPFFLEGDDPLSAPNIIPEQDCSFDDFVEVFEQRDGEQQGFWTAYVTCENDTTMAPVSMFITLQPLP